jgi:DNA-binding MarR family transcriptional regulator
MHVFRDWDYSKQDIAENSDVSSRHAAKAIDKLEKLALIKKTRNVGRAQMYQYNMQNPAAQLLQKFALELAGQEAQKIADQEIAKEEAARKVQTETVRVR